ncbi:MAG: transcriptional regulator [Bacteroidales bacterium]|jgi:DNA-binding HxlR family transcriptional regulator|nr:transcriptional regulator [Bacteroidales bacterium]
MKEILNRLSKLLENRVRLGIMSALMVNESIDFNTLKELLDVTDGNLASHMKMLEKHGLVKVTKQFIGKKPKTNYSITARGRNIFNSHLSALEQLMNKS